MISKFTFCGSRPWLASATIGWWRKVLQHISEHNLLRFQVWASSNGTQVVSTHMVPEDDDDSLEAMAKHSCNWNFPFCSKNFGFGTNCGMVHVSNFSKDKDFICRYTPYFGISFVHHSSHLGRNSASMIKIETSSGQGCHPLLGHASFWAHLRWLSLGLCPNQLGFEPSCGQFFAIWISPDHHSIWNHRRAW